MKTWAGVSAGKEAGPQGAQLTGALLGRRSSRLRLLLAGRTTGCQTTVGISACTSLNSGPPLLPWGLPIYPTFIYHACPPICQRSSGTSLNLVWAPVLCAPGASWAYFYLTASLCICGTSLCSPRVASGQHYFLQSPQHLLFKVLNTKNVEFSWKIRESGHRASHIKATQARPQHLLSRTEKNIHFLVLKFPPLPIVTGGCLPSLSHQPSHWSLTTIRVWGLHDKNWDFALGL